MRRGIGLVALCCGFLGSGASAEVATEMLSFTEEHSILLPYDGFDPSLGSLTGVRAVLEGAASIAEGEVTGTTGGEFPDLFATFVEGYLSVGGAGLIRLSGFLDGVQVSCFLDPARSATCTVAYPGLSGQRFSDSDTAKLVSDFEKSGSLDLRLTTIAHAASGALVSGPTTRWLATGNVTLEYVYDPAPVPLPAGLPLLMAGLGVLGLAARRRS